MIAAVALIPATPILLMSLTGPGARDLEPLRRAVDDAVAHVLAFDPRRVVVAARRETGTLAGFGGPLRTSVPTPRSQHIKVASTSGWRHELGRELLRSAGADITIDDLVLPEDAAGGARSAHDLATRWDPVTSEGAETRIDGVLVLADGSATRGPRSPLGDDPSGEQFDTECVVRLRSGAQPGATDDQARSLGCTGLPGLAFFSALDMPGAAATEIRYEGAPTGVGYIVAIRPCRR